VLTEKPKSVKEVLFPAHLLGVALSRMMVLDMPGNFLSMVVLTVKSIAQIHIQKKDDLPALCFWLSNAIELRSVVFSLQCIDKSGTEVPPSKGGAKVLADLGELITDIFQMVHQKIKQTVLKIVPQAILTHDSTAAAASGFSRFLRGSGVTPQQLAQQLTEIKNIVTAYCLDAHTTTYLFSFVLYTIGTEALNNLFLRKELCVPHRGVSIRYNVSVLEEWCQREGLSELTLHFRKIGKEESHTNKTKQNEKQNQQKQMVLLCVCVCS